MHTTLVVIALASSIVLLLHSERALSIAALAIAGLEALLAFGLISLSIPAVRLDVVLPAILACAGGLAWLRVSAKPAITAATLIAVSAAIQLLLALHVVH